MNNYRNKDYIFIDKLEVFAYHGVFKEETLNGQNFYISLKLYTDIHASAKSDDLELSTNYGTICHFVNDLMKNHTFKLIESVTDFLAIKILENFPLINGLDISIFKPNAPVNLPFKNISINATRGWNKAVIAFGYNIGDRKKYINDAIFELSNSTHSRVLKTSEFIETKPYGYLEQEDFINGALLIETFLTPYELLDYLHTLEEKAGRKRDIHWGPRTLDLDIILFEDLITTDDSLLIPHPEFEKRNFVLNPVKEIAPNMIHPITLKRIKEIPEVTL